MTSPAASDPIASEEPSFYLSKDDEVFGPHTVAELQEFLDASVVGPSDYVWRPGMEEWLTIDQTFALADEGPIPLPTAAVDELPDRADETWEPDPTATVARIGRDRITPRFSGALVTAVVFHLILLASVAWAAPNFLKIIVDQPKVPPAEPPPLEVAFIPEPPDAPPPPPDLPPPPPDVPPPPDIPPPPPAIPDVPIVTPPVPTAVAPPETPRVPQPALDTPSLPNLTIPITRHKAAPPKAAVVRAPTIANASSTDYLNAPPPEYPTDAQRSHEQGTVILLVAVDEGGEPVGVRVEQSSGYGVLDDAARTQVADNYRFTTGPARILRVPIAFRLGH